MEHVSRLAGGLHRITQSVCQVLLGLILIGQLSIVILRYVFGMGFIELQDAVAYSFAALVVLGLPVAQHLDTHVRVDVLRDKQSAATKRWTDRFGVVVFLIPVFGLILWWVWPDIAFAWKIQEGSLETGGLPGLYLVKSTLPLACVLMIVQGVAGLLVQETPRG